VRRLAPALLSPARLAPSLLGVLSLAIMFTGVPGVTPTAVAAPVVPTTAAATTSAATDPGQRPDATSAMVAARASGVRVEDLSQRTETTQVFANPDGTWTSDTADAPVRVQDAKGDWHDIDTSLVNTDGGLAPKYAATDVVLSDGGDKTFAAMTEDGKQLDWRWPSVLPKPTVDRDTATYTDVAPGENLVVTATPTGFTHDLVLTQQPDAPISITMPVSTDGDTLNQTPQGGVSIDTKAGDTVTAAPQALMWDSSKDAAGQPENVATVDTTVGQNASGTPTVTLSPDQKFLTDPDTQYPVTVDPSYTAPDTSDVWVQNADYTAGQVSSPELRAGTYDGGGHIAHSFMHFDGLASSTWRTRHIVSAKLVMRNFYSGSCTGADIRALRITGSWTASNVTWANQPGGGAQKYADYNPAHGYNSSCDSGDATWDITAMDQDWADGAYPNNGIKLKAVDETSIYTWRKYRSANYNGGGSSYAPHIDITYSTYPTASNLSVSPGNAGYARSTGPKVSAQLADPDGGSVTANFSVLSGSTTVWTGSKSATAGGTASMTLPSGTLKNGTSYTLKVSASAGSLNSQSTPTLAFTDDTSAPTTSITCSGYSSSGLWLDKAPASNTCTLKGPADTASWQVTEDGRAITAPVKATSGVGTVSWNPTSGSHTLTATATDQAGNTGAAASFGFGAGPAGMDSPEDNATSAAGFPITMTGTPNATSAYVHWRIQGDTAWNKATQVTLNGSNWDGSAPTTTQTLSDGTAMQVSSPGTLIWAPAGEPLPTTGKLAAPALVEVQGCFTYASGPDSCTPAKPLQLDDGFGGNYATTQLGPVQVALTTGDISYSTTDAATGAAGLGRSWTTSNLGNYGKTSPFGIGWSSDALTPGDTETTVIDRRSDADKSFVISFSTGGDETFTLSTTDTKGVETYLPTDPNDTTSKLVYTPATQPGDPNPHGTTLVLTQNSDTSTTTITSWHLDSTSTPATWVLDGATDPTTQDSADISGGQVNWISQVPAGSSSVCTAATQGPGCRGLALNYTRGHVTTITLKKNGAADQVVATYTYDDASPDAPNTLTKVCTADPGADGPGLCESYTYNLPANGPAQLASITPAGQDAWTLHYDPASGRVVDATRSNPTGGGTSKWVIDYNQPISDPNLPDMTASATAQWGQTEAPATVYAVFSPQADGTTPTTDPTTADLIYTGVDGTVTNTATHGTGAWMVDTTWTNADGNVTQELDGTGYLRVMSAYPADRPGVALDASSFTNYDSGDHSTRVLDEFGPAHTATLIDGTTGQFRGHTHYIYADQDPSLGGTNPDPNGGKAGDLVVETDTSAADPSRVGADYDTKVVRYDYNPIVTTDGNGWTLGMPTQVKTRVDANTWSFATTRYDTAGRVIQARQPGGATDSSGAGTDAHSTTFEYYSADNSDADCKSAAWDGQLCKTGPAAQNDQVPTTYNKTYDDNGNPTDVMETSGNGTSTTTRETVTSYDALGRQKTITKSINGGESTDDNTTIASNITYDAQGNPVTVDDGTSRVTTQYDTWGRATDYTDALGTHSATTYNGAGDIATFNDSAGTYTYSYDGNGNLSSVDTGGAGTYTYTWTHAGNIDTVTLPNGMVQDHTYDEIGTPIGLDYAQGSTDVLPFTAATDVNGRTLSQDSIESHQDFTYDGLGRLTQVQDTRSNGCTTRIYGFDASSNRASFASYGPDATTGGCQTTTADTTRATSYDSAGRPTTSGYTYDNLGRTRTTPAADTQAGQQAAAAGVTGVSAVTATYHIDDMVASLTQTLPDSTGALHTTTTSYGLDPSERINTITTTTDGVETQRERYRFAGESDSPAVIDTSTDGGATWKSTRYVTLPGLGAVATVSGGTAEMLLADPHGDVMATCSSSPGTNVLDSYSETDEYGNQIDTTPAADRYNWLGTYQRSTDAPEGFTLMGARVYNAQTGLFAQNDPVLNGNLTRYGYPEDPVNMLDLTGQMYGWVFDLGVTAVKAVAKIGCAATGGLAFVCNIITSGTIAALAYIGRHAYVEHNSWSSTTAGVVGVSAAVMSVASGLWGRTFGNKIYSFWVGHGSHMMNTLRHWMWDKGWHFLSSYVWTLATKVMSGLVARNRR